LHKTNRDGEAPNRYQWLGPQCVGLEGNRGTGECQDVVGDRRSCLRLYAGCLTAEEQQAQQQERYMQAMAEQDDAFCKQQKVQGYDECRHSRLSYRQTMMTGSAGPQPNAMQNAGQWLQCGRASC
jgi:hypothetical protein